MKMPGILVLFIIIPTFYHVAFGLDIHLSDTINLSDKVLLQSPISFCVTEDDLFLVVDFKAGDVKIYNYKGELETVLGKKGAGPNEFVQPLFCYYTNRKFILSDVGQRKIFFYERCDNFIFERKKSISCLDSGEDFFLKENILFMSGNRISEDGKYYSFYAFNIDKNGDYKYFLPSYLKFGLSSENEHRTELIKKSDLATIGVKGMFDMNGGFAYYAWEGDLKVFRIDLKTGEIKTFGKKMAHFKKPYTTQKLIDSFFSRQVDIVRRERAKMSYVKQIFTSNSYVMVIYTIPSKNNEDNVYMVQFLKMDGTFVQEVVLPGKATNTMWFDKQKSFLYTMNFEQDANLNEHMYILKYKIPDSL